MAPRKRELPVIDLTEDDSPPSKRQTLSLNGASLYGAYSSSNFASSSAAITNQSQSSQSPGDDLEVFDLTQEPEGPEKELYGTLNNKIVGIRYYNGLVTPGEVALCHRESQNQYDNNAIRVDNVVGHQIGHLPRNLVQKLAPYLDRGDITVEATLAGEKGFYDCPVKLSFFGPSNAAERARIETELKKDKLVRATELKQTKTDAETRRKLMGLRNGGSTVGLGTGNVFQAEPDPAAMEKILEVSQVLQGVRDGDAIKTLAFGETELEQMPTATQPEQLASTLLPYQLQGLAWMRSKEDPQFPDPGSADAVQLWKREHSGKYRNLASDFVCTAPPRLLSGGILADDMGLGKTIQIISLILSGGPGATLIVAPVTVMSNWQQQAQRHVKPEHAPKVLVYHGSMKVTTAELLNYDIVVTSYGKLAREMEKGVTKILLAPQAKWRRVVLDEGHVIRNARTKLALAACELKAQSRWVLSGTPIVNSVKDLHSMVKFLRITGGIEQVEVFNAKITRLLGIGSKHAEALLRVLMQDICLRRHKQMKFVDLKLPDKKEYLHRITFRPDEKMKYDALLSEARGALEEYQAKSQTNQKGRFQSVLERLLRLRQTCNHWTLCKGRIDDLLKLLEEQDVLVLNDKNRKLLQGLLRLYIESQEECAICYEVPNDPVITNCKHAFCRPCISQTISIQGKCPMCRNPLTDEALLEPQPEGFDDANFDVETQSSKTEAVLHILKATLKNPGSKVIIFSQWTSFLNIIQNQLQTAGIIHTRIDGKMNAASRDKAIQALDNDPSTRVMLASLAVCGVGLNLVSADTVILADSWWAPAIEDQAVDRVHRLGQTRETTVWRLVVENTVEERVLDIQSEKRALVSKAFREQDGKRKQVKESRIGDVLKLLS